MNSAFKAIVDSQLRLKGFEATPTLSKRVERYINRYDESVLIICKDEELIDWTHIYRCKILQEGTTPESLVAHLQELKYALKPVDYVEFENEG